MLRNREVTTRELEFISKFGNLIFYSGRSIGTGRPRIEIDTNLKIDRKAWFKYIFTKMGLITKAFMISSFITGPQF